MTIEGRSSKNLLSLLFHAVGLGYIIFLEAVLIADFFEDWERICSNAGLILCYALQDVLFFWIVKEMIQSLGRIIERQERVLVVQLGKSGFSISKETYQQKVLQQKSYSKGKIRAIYYNRGAHQKGTDLKSSLLNIPQELYICEEEQAPDAWGSYLLEEQLVFLAGLLHDGYVKGRVEEWLF